MGERARRVLLIVFSCVVAQSTIEAFDTTSGTEPRPAKSDVVILLDQTETTGGDGFKSAIQFLEHYVKASSVSTETKRVGLVSFGRHATVHANLSTSYNREHLLKKLGKLWPKGKKISSFLTALENSMQMLIRQGRPTVPKILVLVSGGHFPSHWSHRSRMHAIEHLNVKKFVVALGWKINPNSLLHFASIPARRHSVWLTPDVSMSKAISLLPDINESISLCTQPRHDECNRRCECVDGELKNCRRIRKEFTQYTREERVRYLTNYKWLSTMERFENDYVPFVASHRIFFSDLIHTADHFLPWHRWYLWGFENMLRQLDCRITIPYWDWTYWSPVAFELDKHIWRNEPDWLGGNGKSGNDKCVETGPFADGLWELPEYEDFKQERKITFHPQIAKKYHKRCLRRGFNGRPANLTDIGRLLGVNVTYFHIFNHQMRFGYHAILHCLVGGTMCTFWSANSPLFFFHHGFLDQIWRRWQSKGTEYLKHFFKGLRNATMQHSEYYQDDFYNSDDLPMSVRVAYTQFPAEERDGLMPLVGEEPATGTSAFSSDESIDMSPKALSSVDLLNEPEIGSFEDVNREAMARARDLFGITEEDDDMTRKIRRLFDQRLSG